MPRVGLSSHFLIYANRLFNPQHAFSRDLAALLMEDST